MSSVAHVLVCRLVSHFCWCSLCCHGSVGSHRCPPLFYVGGYFVCILVCAPWTLLVSLKGRPGRVPNPLKLKLQITKPPCGCWELLFWHQLLLSKKIPAYQTAEQGGNIPGPWSFSVRRSEKCRCLSACADSRPRCLLLSVVNCRCLSGVWLCLKKTGATCAY